MKTQNTNGIKVVWAVDPFHENTKTQLRALQSFLKMGRYAYASIQPVAVLHSGSFDPVSMTFPKNWHELATSALNNLVDALKNVECTLTGPIRLLRVRGLGVSTSVDALVHFAIEANAEIILVSSSARSGADRLMLGSFAETLVLRSPVPVLVVNPKAKPHQKITTILFPTDFSSESKKAYARVLTLAKTLGMQVKIFHKLHLPYSNPKLGIVLPPVSRESLRDLRHKVSETAEAWTKRGELMGVRTKFFIDAQGGPALDAIENFSQLLGPKSMIAMASQSGKWSTTILGSLTRQVLRTASCPVLVIHADQPSVVKRVADDIRRLGYAYTAHPLMT